MPDKVLITVDVVLFTILDGSLSVLLIRRLAEPYAGQFALPGGFVLPQETLDDAARRELREETGYRAGYLEQLQTFGDPLRDPRDRVVTVAYFALVPPNQTLQASTDAADAQWFAVEDVPKLAFDHNTILNVAHNRLKGKLDYTGVGFELLPQEFTLSELQHVHEAILGKKLDRRNFRRSIELRKLVEETEAFKPTGRKPARLYRFAAETPRD